MSRDDLSINRRARGYARVSSIFQAVEGVSLEQQEEQVTNYARQEGLVLAGMHIEKGVSGGTRFCERPEGGALLAAVQPGDVIISAKLDRCFRSASDALEVLESLKARRVGLVLLDLGGNVPSGGVAGLIFTVMAAIAAFEKDRIAERISEVKAMQKQQQKFLGGRRPFGYTIGTDKMLVPEPSEQMALALILRLAGERHSLRAIQAAVSATSGLKLSHTAVQRVIRDARVTSPAA